MNFECLILNEGYFSAGYRLKKSIIHNSKFRIQNLFIGEFE